ncbi:DDE-type integrase/transposase/recombinase [Micromonospora sp. RTP1Z1]|uniref:DDE-type integrase/transposase/recombinase n=1 Tax=Micromonospora sp. RTP1Z1 TaxID=2994043 RepID=UPI0039B635E5
MSWLSALTVPAGVAGAEGDAQRGGHRRRAGLPRRPRRPRPIGLASTERYANNPIEADHSQLKHRLRPMRGLRTEQTAQVLIAGRAFIQNLRRGHYELGHDAPPRLRVAEAFSELARAL